MRRKQSRKPAPFGAGFLLLALAALPCAAQVTSGRAYLARMDTDYDGGVSLAEYQQWLVYAFDRMDRDASGTLEPAELPGGRGKPVTRAQHLKSLADTFARQDMNHNGRLDARELAAPPR